MSFYVACIDGFPSIATLHPLGEKAKLRTEVVVTNVAVWATQKCAGLRTKPSTNQSIDLVDRRHDFASKLSAANVAYRSPGAAPQSGRYRSYLGYNRKCHLKLRLLTPHRAVRSFDGRAGAPRH